MIKAGYSFFIAGIQHISCGTGTDMGETKGTHVVTNMCISGFNKEHVTTVSKNNTTQRSLPFE